MTFKEESRRTDKRRDVKERVAAGGVRRALGLDAAGDHLTQIHRRASRRTITVVTRFSGVHPCGAAA